MPDAVDTVVCAPDDGWRYQPKHVEQFPDINKLCNVASCWIYISEYTYDARTPERCVRNVPDARHGDDTRKDTASKARYGPTEG